MIEQLEQLGLKPQEVGVVVVDHGSRREESNSLLLEVAAMFQRVSSLPIVEPAHMELAEPTIAQAFSQCVEKGAKLIVVFPYFLAPGRHWSLDIPALSAKAAQSHPGVRYLVAAPLGLDELMAQIMMKRIRVCLEHTLHDGAACAICSESGGCEMHEC